MLSSPQSSWGVRLRARSLLAALLATSALVLLLSAGPGKTVTGWAGAFLAGSQPAHAVAARAQTTMMATDANLKAAAELRAAFDARQEAEKKIFADDSKRGFLGLLRPGKKPSVLDIIADPDLAYDDRFPKTATMEIAMSQRSDFDQRNPQLMMQGQTFTEYGGPIWPISGEIGAAPAPQLQQKAAKAALPEPEQAAPEPAGA